MTRPIPLLSLWLAAVAVLACTGTAASQTFEAALVAGPERTVHLGLDGVRQGPDTVSASAVLGRAPGLDLSVRRSSSLPPFGTLVFELDGGVRAGPGGFATRARAGGRGTLGPVAARASLEAWTAPPDRFDPLADPGLGRAGEGVALAVGSDVRLDGTWIVSLDARMERDVARAATSIDASATLRARRLLSRTVDGILVVQGRAADRADGRAGVGAGVLVTPRRAPEIQITAWWDAAPGEGDGLRGALGVETRGAVRVDAARLSWRLRVRPLAPQRHPIDANASLVVPWRDGEIQLGASAHRDTHRDVGAAIRLGYARALNP
ncbi:MAG: hypothetical protein U5K81_07750 [Trueperaceae bacterium]|nr:hypothetical protein [Trueperaceae bacterium]